MKTSPGRKSRATRRAAAKNGPQRMADLFPIVGIGASAGGLEAFSELLQACRKKAGWHSCWCSIWIPKIKVPYRRFWGGLPSFQWKK